MGVLFKVVGFLILVVIIGGDLCGLAGDISGTFVC